MEGQPQGLPLQWKGEEGRKDGRLEDGTLHCLNCDFYESMIRRIGRREDWMAGRHKGKIQRFVERSDRLSKWYELDSGVRWSRVIKENRKQSPKT